MRPKNLKSGKKLESKIQDEIIQYLQLRKWIVLPTHGNMYQRGFPDLYATHYNHGPRWIEVKRPAPDYSFTPAQQEWFPKLTAHGTRIWIMTAATKTEYDKLMKPCNWQEYYLFWRNMKCT